MSIYLKSEFLTITKVNKKTSAKMFENLGIGDIIQLSIAVEHVGRRRGGTYAPLIKINNVLTGDYSIKSFNEIEPILSCFEF